MEIEQNRWTEDKGWEPVAPGGLGFESQLVLIFGSSSILKEHKCHDQIKKAYPNALFFGCSTAGEIYGTRVSDDSLVATAIKFEHTRINSAQINISDVENSFQAGERLSQALEKERLVHVLTLSDGININGSDLVRGLIKHLPDSVTVTGGLSGDGDRFEETYV